MESGDREFWNWVNSRNRHKILEIFHRLLLGLCVLRSSVGSLGLMGSHASALMYTNASVDGLLALDTG